MDSNPLERERGKRTDEPRHGSRGCERLPDHRFEASLAADRQLRIDVAHRAADTCQNGFGRKALRSRDDGDDDGRVLRVGQVELRQSRRVGESVLSNVADDAGDGQHLTVGSRHPERGAAWEIGRPDVSPAVKSLPKSSGMRSVWK